MSDNSFQTPQAQASGDHSTTTVPSSADDIKSNLHRGIFFALAAQTMWGLFPAYLHFLKSVPPINIVAYRIVWAFSFLMLLTFVGSLMKWNAWPRWAELNKNFRDARALRQLAIASVLIAINWIVFVVAVSWGRTMDVSVGYYICPQFVVLLGVMFQKEQLSRMQWLAFAVTSVGVLVMAGSKAGFPWFGIMVALSFGFYGLMKKRIACPAMTSLTFETGFLLLPALAFLFYLTSPESSATLAEPAAGWGVQLLLLGAGVFTVVPLSCHIMAVKRLPLSLVGVLQFLGPTIQFGFSVLVFGETLDRPRFIGIILIWVGVAFFLRNAQQAGRHQ